MSVSVDVRLHDQRGAMLAQQSPTQPAFSTDVYRQQLAQADAAINRIIHANLAGGK
jgi:membrane fusion protein (multidrug efflux system)